uniref:Putative secreted peptide n=1 Tax=Anopheles braziliensis TaxID=58242 RepID=A0A2M3ZTL7_9DIPT
MFSLFLFLPGFLFLVNFLNSFLLLPISVPSQRRKCSFVDSAHVPSTKDYLIGYKLLAVGDQINNDQLLRGASSTRLRCEELFLFSYCSRLDDVI